MRKPSNFLAIVSAITAIISSCIGVFYSFGGKPRIVDNIYGQAVTLFGDGIYANDSIMKAGTNKGTDIGIIIIGIILLFTVLILKNKPYASFLQCGLLSIILYATTCLIMGVTFNRLFLLYVVQFGCAFFAFIFTMIYLLNNKSYESGIYNKKLKGTAIFLIISGCSVLQWLAFIIPSVITGKPMEIIDIYTTEPTFVIDLAIILPATFYCGIMLIRKKTVAYQLAPVLLILLTGVAIIVISQTIVQATLGIVLNIGELLGLVILFVILGAFALGLNIKLLKHTNKSDIQSGIPLEQAP